MKARLILFAFVLILVSIYWFNQATAQSLPANLTDQEKVELYRKYKSSEASGAAVGSGESSTYSTPPIFDAAEESNRGSLHSLLAKGRMSASATGTIFAGGEGLKPFGMELFERAGQLSSPTGIASFDDYVLGPGDNILIFLWGRVEKEFNLTVDRQGSLHIPRIGEISVWGQKLSDFERALKIKLKQAYSEFDFTITLGKIRSIRVYVIGEVKKPGAYTISSLTTLFNVLYQAGGPNERGSMRSIKLLRGGQNITDIDLYDFLIKGDNSSDTRLKSGDTIFVPIVGAQISVSGEIKRPAIYELLGGETAAEVLDLAGDATAMAYLSHVTLKRTTSADEPHLLDLNLDLNDSENMADFEILDGDKITIPSIYDVMRNFVSVSGMVKHPSRYQRSDSMRLSDLVNMAQLSPEKVYFKRANLFRTYPDNRREVVAIDLRELSSSAGEESDLLLMDRDSLHVYAISEVEREKFVRIAGEVKIPGDFPLYEGITLDDLIFLAGNLKRAAYMYRAEIAHTDSLGNVTIEHVDLTSNASERTFLIEDDRVYIRKIPEWNLDRKVGIDGEVLFPGEYALIQREESLYDLIVRAGGFTDVAFPRGLVLERASISGSSYKRKIDRVLPSTIELREDSLGNVREINQMRIDGQSLNRIVIDIDLILGSEGKEGDIILQSGDKVFVPQTPSGISVMGAVGASGTIRYEPGERVRYYLERAGGFSKQADKGEIRLIRADGRVLSGGKAHGAVAELGDAIIVPTEIKRDGNFLRNFSSAITIVTGLATTALLVSKL